MFPPCSIRSLAALSLVLTLALAGTSRGDQLIFATGFEQPEYVPGALIGQDGWLLSPTFGAASGPAAAIVPPGGDLTSQVLRVTGAQLQPETDDDPFFYLGLYRRPIGYDAAAHSTSLISIHVQARLDGPLSDQVGTPGDYSQGDAYSVNLTAVGGDGAFGEISISSDGHIYGYSYSGGGSYLFGTPVTLGVFHDLGLDINLANSTTTYLLDGAVIGVDSFAGVFSSTVLDRVVLLNYANLAIPVPSGFERDHYVSYFDNLSVQAVPEPGSISLALIGIALAGLTRWRRGREPLETPSR